MLGALGAIILYVLVSTMSEIDVETNRWRILGVALGVGVVAVLLSLMLPGVLWVIPILAVQVGLIAWGLTGWIGVPGKQALRIAGAFTGIQIALAVVGIVLSTSLKH